jgi:hypothetical protein
MRKFSNLVLLDLLWRELSTTPFPIVMLDTSNVNVSSIPGILYVNRYPKVLEFCVRGAPSLTCGYTLPFLEIISQTWDHFTREKDVSEIHSI